MNEQSAQCIHCKRSSEEIPLIRLSFNGDDFWICPQHLPILIHKPAQLAGKFPGANFPTDSIEHHH